MIQLIENLPALHGYQSEKELFWTTDSLYQGLRFMCYQLSDKQKVRSPSN